MNLYEKKLQSDLQKWRRRMLKDAFITDKAVKKMQNAAQNIIPDKIQNIITSMIKAMIETIMFSSDILTDKKNTKKLTLAQKDLLAKEKYKVYRNTAVIEGAGFGFGGILLGLADFPALLSIKIKFLFDIANLYGFDTDSKEERLFILHVMQLAFSSTEHRKAVFYKILDWDKQDKTFTAADWEKFQCEYRDYIDFAKLLQLLPVVGAAIGAVANHALMDNLYECAINCYRLRCLKNRK